MTPAPHHNDSIEAFNRRVEAMLHGEAAPADGPLDADGLSATDHQALALARRLADLNPSLETHSRYPLRRRLLTQAERQRPARGWNVFGGGLRLTFSLSLVIVLVGVLTWVFTGLHPALNLDQTASPTAYRVPQLTAGLAAPLPPAGAAPEWVRFSPQPIPTPLAPHDNGSPRTRDTGLPRQTPALNASNRPPTGAPSVIP